MAVDDQIICRCCFVHESIIRDVIAENGLNNVDQIGYHCHAGTRCGGCRSKLERILEDIAAGEG